MGLPSRDHLTDAGIPYYILGIPALFGFCLCEEEPTDSRSWAGSGTALYEEIMMALVCGGAGPDPDGREPWFLCAALSEQGVADTLNALEDAVAEVGG